MVSKSTIIRIVAMSDSHGKHEHIKKIPHGDILVVAGDFTPHGTLMDVVAFRTWADELSFKYKIIVPGNHDACFQGKDKEKALQLLGDNYIYLEDEGVTIEGLKFYGMPWMPNYYDWSFMLPRRSEDLADKVAGIPNDTEILITHGPPFGILDEGRYEGEKMGCEILERKVRRMPTLKAHIFGHNHTAHGSHDVFHNVSVLDGRYEWANNPTLIEVET